MTSETIGNATFETWTVEQLAGAFARNEVVVIDVRTPQEYMFEHIEGALLMPMAFFIADKLPGQAEKRIVFHCGSGLRSERVARAAIAAGITRIAHLGGGFAAWKSAGMPYVGTEMSTGAPQRMNG